MELSQLRGIGVKTEEALKKAGINDVNDLLFYFPRTYEIFNEPLTIAQIGYKPFAAVRGAFFQGADQRNTGRLTISRAMFHDETGQSMWAVWFNTPFIKNSIQTGVPYVLRGRISRKYAAPQFDQPRIYKLSEYDKLQGSLQPVYSNIKGVSNTVLAKAVKCALESEAYAALDEEDFIPESIKRSCRLMSRSQAVKNIHFPENETAFSKGMQRLSFEEIFLFIYQMKRSQESAEMNEGIVIPQSERISGFIGSLPYKLTVSQQKVLDEIFSNMSSGKLMNRLIQGDVGSGKTIVALISLMNAAFSGYQGALMAPTEVLAAQHHKKISSLFSETGIGLKAALLTGSMTAAKKDRCIMNLKKGILISLSEHMPLYRKRSGSKNWDWWLLMNSTDSERVRERNWH